SRVAVFDVEGVNFHDGLLRLESESNQESFGAAIAGSEREVSDTIENGVPTIDFEGLYDVRVVSNDRIRAAVNRETGLRTVFGRRYTFVWHAPVESDHNPVDALAKPANVSLESFRRIHSAAWFFARRRATPVPVVAKKTDPQPSRIQNHRGVGRTLICSRAEREHVCARQNF